MNIKEQILNSDGTIKTKEQFLKEQSLIYDDVSLQTNQHFLAALAETNINPIDIIDKYHFFERKIYLNTEITHGIGTDTEDTGRSILERIQFWNAEDEFDETPVEKRIPIQIYIDCPGGDLTTTLLIVDAIKNSKTPVYTIVTGTAYSGGFFVAIAGHKRFAFPNATFLLHEGCGGTYGDAHKVRQGIKFYELLLNKIKKHTIESTQISEETYEKHEKDDWYFDTKKALKLGVIDEISTDVNGGLYND